MTYDKQLYSRQEFTVGSDAQGKLSDAEVILVGLSGVGVEIAKNLTLIGISKLTLVDDACISYDDLSTNFFVGEQNIGQPRGKLVASKLCELNPSVRVEVMDNCTVENTPIESILKSVIVVVVNSSFSDEKIIQLNKTVRSNGKGFILVENYGVSGCVFVDFGPAFRVVDTNGEDFASCIVEKISTDGRIDCHDDQKHGLERGDLVEFQKLKDPLLSTNGKRFYVKDVFSPYSFSVDTNFDTLYTGGGQVTGKKQEQVFSFESLQKQIESPTIIPSDFAKFDDGETLHYFFRAIHAFLKESSRLPSASSTEAQRIIDHMRSLGCPQNFNEELIRRLTKSTQGSFVGISSFLGGLVAHEALKGISGKFTPIRQFYYFDAREILPLGEDFEVDTCKNPNRYSAQSRIFGELNQRFLKQKFFIVGAGALGCELVKCFALSGIGCSSDGKVTITDMDTVEKSNLSRQFLFRSDDIGSFKSECAAKRAKTMNPNFNIIPLQEKVSDETIEVFNDSFWETLDGVCTALDNIQSRQWVDGRCVYYRVPLIDSGTLGSSANSQVVIPYLTESYSSSADPPEKSIPVCTLKNFPSKIEHTIQWARDAFEGIFYTQILQTKEYLSDPKVFFRQLDSDPASKESIVKSVESVLKSAPESLRDCVIMARKLFDEYYVNNIRDLLVSFPPDSVTSEGKPFWTGAKKQPVQIEYDCADDDHQSFIVSSAMLFATAFSIDKTAFTSHDILRHAKEYSDDELRQPMRIDGQEHQSTSKEIDSPTKQDMVLTSPQAYAHLSDTLCPISFEKDEDENFHIRFITACSNIRARNYAIDRADFYLTKKIAGRIIPAMITTTAAIVGLVMIELAKLIVHPEPDRTLDMFKNAFLNFAIGFTAFSEPLQPKQMSYGPADDEKKHTWSIWNRFDVDFGYDATVSQFLEYFEKTHGIEISMISHGVSIIYSFFSSKRSEVLSLTISGAVRRALSKEIPPHVKYLDFEILCTIDDNDADVPPVRYKLY